MISNILNRLFSKDKSLVNIIQYPTEYVIETFNSSDTGTWVRSNYISKASINITLEELKKLIEYHLDSSKKINYEKYDIKSVNENYSKITKRNTIKKQMEDAKLVSIYRDDNKIEIIPHRNGGTSGNLKGFTPIDDKKILLNLGIENMNLVTEKTIKIFAECE